MGIVSLCVTAAQNFKCGTCLLLQNILSNAFHGMTFLFFIIRQFLFSLENLPMNL
jgi:hypothetical protein